ncbi:hypothetical protein GA0061102_101152 [Rhizobium miluonense]|uniref:Uncharacterized protein n=1 Tax=Rhizobium miluonense TaxID=411945 RepID=A0A1C3VC31_9HYPH|nr:hypothetical protein GA0061102_101152 [Rhizobium miluonense]
MHFEPTASTGLEYHFKDRPRSNATRQPGKYAPNVGLSPLEPPQLTPRQRSGNAFTDPADSSTVRQLVSCIRFTNSPYVCQLCETDPRISLDRCCLNATADSEAHATSSGESRKAPIAPYRKHERASGRHPGQVRAWWSTPIGAHRYFRLMVERSRRSHPVPGAAGSHQAKCDRRYRVDSSGRESLAFQHSPGGSRQGAEILLDNMALPVVAQ